MTAEDKALLSEMLRRCGDERTADEFLRDIAEASIEELQAWHQNAKRMRVAAGLVMDAIESRRPIEARDEP